MAQPQYPAGITTCTFNVGMPLGWDGIPDIQTTVAVTPSDSLIWKATGDRLVKFTNTFTGNAGGTATFTVPHVDQPGFVLPGTLQQMTWWRYVVEVTWTHSGGGTERQVKVLQPIAGQSTVDFDLAAESTVEGEKTTIPTVVSVNGKTGAVQLELGQADPAVVRTQMSEILPGMITGSSTVAVTQDPISGNLQLSTPPPLTNTAVEKLIGSSLAAANSNVTLAYDQATGKTYIGFIPPATTGGGSTGSGGSTGASGGSNPMFLVQAPPDQTNCPGATVGDWALNERDMTLWRLEKAY